MEPKLVLACLADAETIAGLFRAAREQAMPWLPDLHSPEEDRAFFRGLYDACETQLWTTQSEAELTGFLVHKPGWVEHLYIHPRWQGQGHGRLLLSKAQRLSDKLQLWTFQRNTGAREFYKRQGFAEVELTDGAGNEEREPDVRLEWQTQAAGSL